MASLKANVLQIREDLQNMTERHNRTQTPIQDENFFNLFDFPLKADHELQKVNEYLEEDSNFKNAVKQMVKLGRKDTYDLIRRCFQETFSDVRARGFTYHGTKEKKSFKDLRLGMVYLGASQEHGANRKSTEISIRKWLRRANERHQSKIKGNTRSCE